MHKFIYTILLVISLLLAVPLAGQAGHGRVYVGANIHLGYPGWGGYYGGWHHYRPWWGPRYYWPGPVVMGPWYPYGYYATPPVVIQQPAPTYVQPEEQQADYWYYCQNPQGYYPYIKSCPGGWMKVVPETVPPNP
jgi:hypothetical protein